MIAFLVRLPLVAIITLIACFTQASCAEEVSPPKILTERPSVPLEKFQRLKGGMTRDEVDRLLSIPGQHLYTDRQEDGSVYLLRDYAVAPAATEFTYSIYLLFKDDRLFALLDADELAEIRRKKWEADGKTSQGIPEKRSFQDDALIKEIIESESYRDQRIAEMMPELQERILTDQREWEAVMRRSKPNRLPTEVLELIATMIKKEDFEVNARHVERFNPEKVQIGMSIDEVNHLFGPPLYDEEISQSEYVGLYGPEVPRTVGIEVAVSPVMVLYRNGKVVRVLSHGYFNAWWKEKIWPKPGGQ